jgi:F0F1-type ATP synthase assembly protein I
MDTRFFLKLVLSVALILTATQLGRKLPSLGGLVSVMPLTSLVVMIWLWTDRPRDSAFMSRFCWGALWGIVPTILFFISAYLCFRAKFPLWMVLTLSFAVWLGGAVVHQFFLRS